jgi:GNAT superfamily N-acetyltransferase
MTRHPVGRLLADAAHGRFPPVDGIVEVVRPWNPGVEGVVSFTGRAYVVTERSAAEVQGRGPDGYGGAVDPRFVSWLAGPDGWCDCLDALLTAFGTGTGGPAPRPELAGHPRVRHARLIRARVAVHGDDRGLITLGSGVGGLAEIGVEVSGSARGRGVGRSLIADALGLVDTGTPAVAAVAPGNALALRAFLAAGFTLVGSVQLVRPRPSS